MKRIIVKLKQHTPILHFQSEQEGATLRASEVKPKLDKYILKKNGGENGIKSDHQRSGWLISKEHPALNYKMRIEIAEKKVDKAKPVQKKDGKMMIPPPPMYFAGPGKQPVIEMNQERDYTTITIICMNESLAQEIKNRIVKFFNGTTFGTRQSKGYGSYTVASIDDNGITDFTPENYYSYFTVNQDKWRDTLNKIDEVWKYIRCYATKEYAEKKGYSWEKDLIKTAIERRQFKNHIDEYRDVKDNLGLSTTEYWKSYNLNAMKSCTNGIQRMQSPVLFKPVKYKNIYRVYIILNETIHISNGTKLNVKFKTPRNSAPPAGGMPSSISELKFLEDFNLVEFMNYAITKSSGHPFDEILKNKK
jgi:hypothetical protein